MRTFTQFKETYEDSAYVCGLMIKKKIKSKSSLLLIEKNSSFKPCGMTLRPNDVVFFDHNIYIENLRMLLHSSLDTANQPLFTGKQVTQIIEYESFCDIVRGSVAPYFRVVVYSFVNKVGIFPAQMSFLARTDRERQTLATYLFTVHIAWSPQADGSFQYIDSRSENDICCKYPITSEKLKILLVNDTLVYPGKSFQYKKLYSHIA
jgi:hypothetical protein